MIQPNALDAASLFAPRPPRVTLQTLEITWRADDALRLAPFPGSTLRGALGRALRPLVCITGADTCEGCLHQPHCAYGYVWDGTLPPGAPKRLRNPQRPYVVEMPFSAEPVNLRPGDPLRCRLKLFGSARAFAPTLVPALVHAGRRGFGGRRVAATLERVERRGDGAIDVLYTRSDGLLPVRPGPPVEVTPAPGPTPDRIVLDVRTPLALKRRGALLETFDPEVFTARLGERFDAISAAHEGVLPAWDFGLARRLAAVARVVRSDLRPVRFARNSARSRGKVGMEGVVGTVHLAEVHPDVLSLWRCAEHLHVGKNAVFGFGAVRVADA